MIIKITIIILKTNFKFSNVSENQNVFGIYLAFCWVLLLPLYKQERAPGLTRTADYTTNKTLLCFLTLILKLYFLFSANSLQHKQEMHWFHGR